MKKKAEKPEPLSKKGIAISILKKIEGQYKITKTHTSARKIKKN